MRLLKGYAEDIKTSCNPSENPAAFRNCQEAARPAVEGLLSLVQASTSIDTQITALTAMSCMCFGNLENASEVVTSSLFGSTMKQALLPIIEIRQQEEVLAALQLLQAICAVAPEAPSIVPILPTIVALLAGTQEGHAACDAVRMTALEVLVSCSLSTKRRSQLTSLLPESILTTVVNDVGSNGGEMAFPLGLLLANLSDLCPMPAAEANSSSISNSFWEQTGFLNALLSCLEATLRSQPWPPQSGIYHAPWKLANTYLRLSRAGFQNLLHLAVVPLVALVERRANNENILSADDARAARLSAEVLRELATTDTRLIETMRSAQQLTEALVNMQAEEPAARDLLALLATEKSALCQQDLGCMTAQATPW